MLTGLIKFRKMTFKKGRELLLGYLRSSCFLCMNGFGYLGFFCILRHLLRHINFLTASFLPAFLSSICAILIERPERRPLLAIYVTNVASESLWQTALEYGYVRSIPRGEVLIFMAAMTVLGYYFRTPKPLSKMMNSILQIVLGRDESGIMIQPCQSNPVIASESVTSQQPSSWMRRLLSMFTKKHSACPHKRGCIPHIALAASRGFAQGFLLQLALTILPSVPRLWKSPSKLYPMLSRKGNISAGLFLGCFISVFKGTCCVGRWWHGKDEAWHGALAGAFSALSMYMYSSPSLALYIMWKTLEGLYENGCEAGYLPRIPGSVEFIYCLATAYLFHTSVMDDRNLKKSYHRFLDQLTWGRMYQYNRHLLRPYGFDSHKGFEHYWPKYDRGPVSDAVKQLRPESLNMKTI